MTHPAPATAELIAPFHFAPNRQPAIKAVIPGGAAVCHIDAKGVRTATYVVEVVHYSCDPWESHPTATDSATISLEAPIDLLCSEALLSGWVTLALPGWSYLSSYNACSLQVAPEFGPEPF